MKTLKFRAWDKDSQRYGEVVEIEYNSSREIDGVWVWYNIHERYEPIPGANATVEQCTGLKDRNGKEIYEGDILDVSSVFVEPKKMVVEFSEMACGFEPFVNGCPDCYAPIGKDVVVIGNIHENPELLEMKKNETTE